MVRVLVLVQALVLSGGLVLGCWCMAVVVVANAFGVVDATVAVDPAAVAVATSCDCCCCCCRCWCPCCSCCCYVDVYVDVCVGDDDVVVSLTPRDHWDLVSPHDNSTRRTETTTTTNKKQNNKDTGQRLRYRPLLSKGPPPNVAMRLHAICWRCLVQMSPLVLVMWVDVLLLMLVTMMVRVLVQVMALVLAGGLARGCWFVFVVVLAAAV